MMHKVWFIASNSYNLICNYLEWKINKWKLSKGTIQKYLPGLIKAMHNCGIEFDSNNLKKILLNNVNLKLKHLKSFTITKKL